jgi:hypothetical protein
MARTIVIPRAVLEATRNCLCLFFTCTTIGLAIGVPFVYFHDPTSGSSKILPTFSPPLPPPVAGLTLGSPDEEYCTDSDCWLCATLSDKKCDWCGGGCLSDIWYCSYGGAFPSSTITGSLCCRHTIQYDTFIDINTDCKSQNTFSNTNCVSIDGTCKMCDPDRTCQGIPDIWYCNGGGVFPSSAITGSLCCRHHTDDHTVIDINTDCNSQNTFPNTNCRSINGTCNTCNAKGMCN